MKIIRNRNETIIQDIDDGVSFVGKDNYIVAFSLTVDGVTYDASITEGKIKVSIPYNVSLENAKAFMDGNELKNEVFS